MVKQAQHLFSIKNKKQTMKINGTIVIDLYPRRTFHETKLVLIGRINQTNDHNI